MKRTIWSFLLLACFQHLSATDTYIFKGYLPKAKYTDDTFYPVVGIGERKPLLLIDDSVRETTQGWIQLEETIKISDQSIDLSPILSQRRENALILTFDITTKEPLENGYVLLVYRLPNKPLPRCKSAKLPPLSVGTQSVRLRFNSNGLPEDVAFGLHFFHGAQELYTNLSEDLIEATPEQALKLKLTRLLRQIGTGNSNPEPFFTPLDKNLIKSAFLNANRTTLKVRLTIKENGKIKKISFAENIPTDLKTHLRESIINWLFFPRIHNGSPIEQEIVLPIQL